MAAALRHLHPTVSLALAFHPLPRLRTQQQSSLYLVPPQSRDSPELSRPSGFHGAISTLGADGVQPGAAWQCAQG